MICTPSGNDDAIMMSWYSGCT